MREIKFRFWSKILERFVIPDHSIYEGAFRDEEMGVMQYTGLKERNGKEIYEGDIIRYKDKGNLMESGVYEIKWDSDETAFTPLNNLSGCREYKYPRSWWIDRTVEVVGNIYENPELLGEVND